MAENNKRENDAVIQRLMDQNSIRTTVISYLLTVVYAVVAAIAAMAMREMIETVATKIIAMMADSLSVNQPGGIRRLVQIRAIVLMVALWSLTFMLGWHKVEKSEGRKARLKTGLIWIAGAIALYLVFGLVQYFVVGYWPMLTGAV